MKNWSLKHAVCIWVRRLNTLGLSVVLAVWFAACVPEKQTFYTGLKTVDQVAKVI